MPTRNPLILPIAVLIALVIIGVAVFIGLRKDAPQADTLRSAKDLANVAPISKDDWVLGNPNAPIVYVVYSDFECPYCKQYHATMHQLMKRYGKDGQMAWVFRHLPFVQLHTKAPTEALASECVGSVGGNDAFWKFADILFAETPSNDQLDLSLLPGMAERAGVSRAEFEACMRSDRLMRRVQEDFEEAIKAGAVGSPYTVVLAAGQQIRFEGAQLYPAMTAVMETLLRAVNAPGLAAPSEGSMVDAIFSNPPTTAPTPEASPSPESVVLPTSTTSTPELP